MPLASPIIIIIPQELFRNLKCGTGSVSTAILVACLEHHGWSHAKEEDAQVNTKRIAPLCIVRSCTRSCTSWRICMHQEIFVTSLSSRLCMLWGPAAPAERLLTVSMLFFFPCASQELLMFLFRELTNENDLTGEKKVCLIG